MAAPTLGLDEFGIFAAVGTAMVLAGLLLIKYERWDNARKSR